MDDKSYVKAKSDINFFIFFAFSSTVGGDFQYVLIHIRCGVDIAHGERLRPASNGDRERNTYILILILADMLISLACFFSLFLCVQRRVLVCAFSFSSYILKKIDAIVR